MKNVRVKIDFSKRLGINFEKGYYFKVNWKNDVDSVFTNVNCQLKVVFKDKRSSFFKDIDDLKKLIDDRIS